jgi:hypothetical protein
MTKKALVVALAVTFVATPAMARPWHEQRGRQHAAGHGAELPVRYHEVDDDAVLWLGLAALGIGTLYALSRAPHPDLARWNPPTRRRERYVPRRVDSLDRPLTLAGEGFYERGQYCREFHQDIRIGHRSEQAWGTTCLQEDGSWRVTH